MPPVRRGAFEFSRKDWHYAVNMIETVAWLGGQDDYLETVRDDMAELKLFDGPRAARSARLFDWLVRAMSYQGISDEIARSYMALNEMPRRRSIARGVSRAQCRLLGSFWEFQGCGYRKSSASCSQPQLIGDCPLPQHRFRNGNLNQLAYSLFLFIRDVAGGDLVRWIDVGLAEAEPGPSEWRLTRMYDAVVGPLKGVYGAADKVLSMTLSALLLGGKPHDQRWLDLGASMIAIDTLVHNFLTRTGILARAHARHAYGPHCYGPKGCAALVAALSDAIDARQFNDEFPRHFPRYLQLAIWRYSSIEGLGLCNGTRINDLRRCENTLCRLYEQCDRIKLGRVARKMLISAESLSG
jgi:hypothetical protein